nr:hypothetical protein BaRGS_011081 [Batillaria attramentaria]
MSLDKSVWLYRNHAVATPKRWKHHSICNDHYNSDCGAVKSRNNNSNTTAIKSSYYDHHHQRWCDRTVFSISGCSNYNVIACSDDDHSRCNYHRGSRDHDDNNNNNNIYSSSSDHRFRPCRQHYHPNHHHCSYYCHHYYHSRDYLAHPDKHDVTNDYDSNDRDEFTLGCTNNSLNDTRRYDNDDDDYDNFPHHHLSDITFVRLDSQFLGLEFTSLKYVFGDDFMDISKIGFRQGTGYVYVYN